MNKNILKDFSKYVSFNIWGQIAYSCYTLADTSLYLPTSEQMVLLL